MTSDAELVPLNNSVCFYKETFWTREKRRLISAAIIIIISFTLNMGRQGRRLREPATQPKPQEEFMSDMNRLSDLIPLQDLLIAQLLSKRKKCI